MVSKPPARQSLLGKLASRPHRYRVYWLVSQTITMLVLFAVPLTRMARFDVWGGEHYSLTQRVGAVEGLVAVTVAIACFYLATFVINAFVGRLFCGWGCPISQIHRLSESTEIAMRTGKRRATAILLQLLFSTALSTAVLLWWVSPRVLVDGSTLARTVAIGTLVLLVALTFLHGRYWRWRFCEQFCPVGLYYSVVTIARSHGVLFDERLKACKDCGLCELICPVGLDPRDLSEKQSGGGGLAIDDLPALNHCLSCGDCVEACELAFAAERGDDVTLRFGLGEYGRPLPSREPEIDDELEPTDRDDWIHPVLQYTLPTTRRRGPAAVAGPSAEEHEESSGDANEADAEHG